MPAISNAANYAWALDIVRPARPAIRRLFWGCPESEIGAHAWATILSRAPKPPLFVPWDHERVVFVELDLDRVFNRP